MEPVGLGFLGVSGPTLVIESAEPLSPAALREFRSYEEYEIWIVTHSFQDARPETVDPTPERKSGDTGENRP